MKYLVVGGYAVAYHGYPRTTGDIGLWIERAEENTECMVRALKEFGFDVPKLKPALFLKDDQIVRMGYPPLRVEIMTNVSGVDFSECYERRVIGEMGGVRVSIIGLECLKKNKQASGTHKDQSDLENLP